MSSPAGDVPSGCEFCLSSREDKLRRFDIDRLLEKLETLIARGCKGFKFIDRTFNVDDGHWSRILDFFYEHWPREDAGTLVRPISTRQAALGSVRGESFFLHFEVVPDRFDDKLIESLARFPAGGIQLEVGIQTLDPVVGERIGRRVDAETVARNLSRLKSGTGVHIHADLIIGLPGEDENGFARSFDSLRAMNPDEIQLGILKLLPGAPIIRHADTYSMSFNRHPLRCPPDRSHHVFTNAASQTNGEVLRHLRELWQVQRRHEFPDEPRDIIFSGVLRVFILDLSQDRKRPRRQPASSV
jgi:tRNA A37 methylthiotransferase MiaB